MANITSRDIELIFQQCKNQNAVSFEQLLGFANAYVQVKQISQDGLYLDVRYLIFVMANYIEPSNVDYRRIPVVFANGGKGADYKEIPRLMASYCKTFQNNTFLTPLEAYIEFEKIHPFVDGNGRIGHLLWALYTVLQGDQWPLELPPIVDF